MNLDAIVSLFVFVLVPLLMVGSVVLMIVTLVKVLRIDPNTWQRIRQQQLLWLLVVLVAGPIGAIAFLIVVPKAIAAARSPSDAPRLDR